MPAATGSMAEESFGAYCPSLHCARQGRAGPASFEFSWHPAGAARSFTVPLLPNAVVRGFRWRARMSGSVATAPRFAPPLLRASEAAGERVRVHTQAGTTCASLTRVLSALSGVVHWVLRLPLRPVGGSPPSYTGARRSPECRSGRKRAYQISSSLWRVSPNPSNRTPIRSISERYRLQARRLSSPALR